MLVEAKPIAMENLTTMDAPENMPALHRLGVVAGERQVLAQHFSAAFDLN